MNKIYTSRISISLFVWLLLSIFSVGMHAGAIEEESHCTEIAEPDPGKILVRGYAVNDQIQLRLELPEMVLYRITSMKGELLKSGKSEAHLISVKGFSKGNYHIEVSVDGENIKEVFAILY